LTKREGEEDLSSHQKKGRKKILRKEAAFGGRLPHLSVRSAGKKKRGSRLPDSHPKRGGREETGGESTRPLPALKEGERAKPLTKKEKKGKGTGPPLPRGEKNNFLKEEKKGKRGGGRWGVKEGRKK